MNALKKFYDRIGEKLFGIFHSEKGQTLVEYALLLVLIALVVFAVLQGTGEQVNNTFSRINNALSQ